MLTFFFPPTFLARLMLTIHPREIEKRAKFPTLLYSRDVGKYTRPALLSIYNSIYRKRERKTRKRERKTRKREDCDCVAAARKLLETNS